MKKLLCMLAAAAMLLSFAACEPEDQPDEGSTVEKVTIFIPDKLLVYGPEGTLMMETSMEYEKDWQKKESFTISYGSEANAVGMNVEMVYGDKSIVTQIPNVYRTESFHDENGRLSRQVTEYLNNLTLQKIENSYTYDEQGRRLTQETKTYYAGNEEPTTATQTFTYTETETGSKGTFTEGSITYIIEYNKEFRLTAQSTIVNDEEVTRTELTYDEHGNNVSSATYSNGQKISETRFTYKKVEISKETADRLPTFKRAN